MATIRDIADRTGLSRSTVSRCLSGNGYVSEEARNAIEEAARDLDYQPNSAAVSLRRGKSGRIVVFVPTTAHSYYATFISGVGEGARRHGYDLLLRQATGEQAPLQAQLRELERSRIADGAIIASTIADDAGKEVTSLGLPVVACDQVLYRERIPSVYMDHYQSTIDVLEHLVSRGRRAIYVVISDDGHASSYYREKAAEEFLRQRIAEGMRIRITCVVENDDDSVSAGVALGKRLFELDRVPDAVFTGSDQLAAGMLLFARRVRLSVPGELAIVGFDDQSLSEALGLTTVYQPTRKMGAKAVEVLHRLIEGRPAASTRKVERYRVMHTLRVRGTT